MAYNTDKMNTISLAQFRKLFPVSDCLSMGDDLSVINVRYDSGLRVLSHPSRFDGYLAFFCISGNLRMMINLTEFDVVEDSLFINLPERYAAFYSGGYDQRLYVGPEDGYKQAYRKKYVHSQVSMLYPE